jgi:hypothetical protein
MKLDNSLIINRLLGKKKLQSKISNSAEFELGPIRRTFLASGYYADVRQEHH